jgi:hypothetical protein
MLEDGKDVGHDLTRGNFEGFYCLNTSHTQFDWLRKSGATLQSDSGPIEDFTYERSQKWTNISMNSVNN